MLLRNDVIKMEILLFFKSMYLSNLPRNRRSGCTMIENDHKERMDNNL